MPDDVALARRGSVAPRRTTLRRSGQADRSGPSAGLWAAEPRAPERGARLVRALLVRPTVMRNQDGAALVSS